MKNKKFNRLFAMLLAVVMVIGLVSPATVMAAGEVTVGSSAVKVDKTAVLEADGTYTINLEAYATGETTTTTTTVEKGIPLDICIVVDQSGSMAEKLGNNYKTAAKTAFSYSDLGSDKSYYYKDTDGAYYEVERKSTGRNPKKYYLSYTVGRTTYYLNANGTSSTSLTYTITDASAIIYNGTLYTPVTRLDGLKSAVTSFVENISENAKQNNVDHKIALVGYACGTRNDMGDSYASWAWKNTGIFLNGALKTYNTVGSSAANSQFTAADYENALVSVNDNTGKVQSSITTAINSFAAEGATFTNYGIEMGNSIFDANPIRGERKRIMVVFTDGTPGYSGYDSNVANDAVKQAYDTKQTYDATVYTIGLLENPGDNVTTFMNCTSSNYPNAQSTSNTGTKAADKYYYNTYSEEGLMEIFQTISNDVSSESSSTDITLNASAIMRDVLSENFHLPENYSTDNVTVKTQAGSTANGTDITWGAESQASGTTVTVDKATGTIDVSGFDYSAKYIAKNHPGEKLKVTIKGVLANDGVSGVLPTNSNTSGIYSGTEMAAQFPVPQVEITQESHVLDYAKPVRVPANGSVAVDHGFKKQNTASYTTSAKGTYGKAVLGTSGITYEPATMQWDGIDNYGSLLKSGTAYQWSQISFIPANNVYYEDDFITVDNGEDSKVGIVYTGDWTTVTASGGNTEDVDGETHGWVESLSDDAQYSDGSVHSSSTQGASAVFTFTGTGVDIYSRTNSDTGVITAKLVNEEGTVNTYKYLTVDSLAASGDYYQIPTVSFENLTYGTYTVTLKVSNAGGERMTYYLDGIRVYNPLGNVVDDGSIASDAYKADGELNAVFTEVRDLLLDTVALGDAYAEIETPGVVFIDQMENGAGGTTSDLGTYKTYGPKNEVYLASGQAIALSVNNEEGKNYYLGLKAPEGSTTVEMTNGSDKSTLNIKAASDLYYKLIPDSNGTVVVQNTGSNLLAVTKLRTTAESDVSVQDIGIQLLSLEAACEAVDAMPALASVPYTMTAPVETPGDVIVDEPEEEQPEKEEKPGNGKKPEKEEKPGNGKKPEKDKKQSKEQKEFSGKVDNVAKKAK